MKSRELKQIVQPKFIFFKNPPVSESCCGEDLLQRISTLMMGRTN